MALRLSDDLLRQLDELVSSTHPSRSDAVRRAIEIYLYRLACDRDAQRYQDVRLTEAELAFSDDSAAWSGTPPW